MDPGGPIELNIFGMKQNNLWIKIALIEAILIIVLSVILFWPVEHVSMDDYHKSKINASNERTKRLALQNANNTLIVKLTAKESELKDKINELETTKSINNEKLDVDISIINDVDLDSAIVIGANQQNFRPKGY